MKLMTTCLTIYPFISKLTRGHYHLNAFLVKDVTSSSTDFFIHYIPLVYLKVQQDIQLIFLLLIVLEIPQVKYPLSVSMCELPF